MKRTKTSLETLARKPKTLNNNFHALELRWPAVPAEPLIGDCCLASCTSCAATVHIDHIVSYCQNSRACNRNKIHKCQRRALCWIALASADGETAWSAAALGSAANVPALSPDYTKWKMDHFPLRCWSRKLSRTGHSQLALVEFAWEAVQLRASSPWQRSRNIRTAAPPSTASVSWRGNCHTPSHSHRWKMSRPSDSGQCDVFGQIRPQPWQMRSGTTGDLASHQSVHAACSAPLEPSWWWCHSVGSSWGWCPDLAS